MRLSGVGTVYVDVHNAIRCLSRRDLYRRVLGYWPGWCVKYKGMLKHESAHHEAATGVAQQVVGADVRNARGSIMALGCEGTVSTLTFHFSRPRDLLEKLSRDRVRLDSAASTYSEQQIADALFDFCGTGYAVKDWLKESFTNAFQPGDVENYVRSVPALSACRDICNASKHFMITRYMPSAGDVYASASAATVAAMQVPTAGVGLESDSTKKFRVKVLLKDGTKFEVTELARLVIDAWERFFAANGM